MIETGLNWLAVLAGMPLRVKLTVFGGLLALGAALTPLRVGIVQGESMSPTLENGQFYLLDRGYYRNRPVRRGDVVVFKHNGVTYVKRVLAVGGDSVYLLKQRGAEEDQLIPAWQLDGIRRVARGGPWSRTFKLVERRLPPGYVYVVGDHVQASVDSRVFGPVPVEEIRGRVPIAGESSPMLEQFAGHFLVAGPRG